MRQKLSRRLEQLEKVRAACVARRVGTSQECEEQKAKIAREADAWYADPVNQAWLAAQPPEYLAIRMQSLRRELTDIEHGHRRMG
jgi:hypothetical protein